MAELSGTVTLQSDSSPVAGADVLALSNTVLTDTFTVTVATDLFTSTTAGHGLVNGNVLRFTGAALPAPLVVNKDYFVVEAAADTFKVSETKGGAVLTITTEGTPPHTFTAKVWDVAGSSISLPTTGNYAIDTGADEGPFSMHCESVNGTTLVSTGKAGVTVGAGADAFIMSITTTTSPQTITFPTEGTFTVDWGDGSGAELIEASNPTHQYTTAGSYTITCTNWATPRIQYNNGGDRLLVDEISQWGTAAWTSMQNAFYGCNNLDVTATDTPDLSAATTIRAMFRECHSLTGAAANWAWDISTINNTADMFSMIGATNTTFNGDVSGWNTIFVTNMVNMFRGCTAFNQNIGSWNTGSVVFFQNMFSLASSFDQDLSGWSIASINATGSLSGGGSWFASSGMSVANYSKMYISFANQVSANSAPYTVNLSNNNKSYDNTVYAGIQGGSPYTDAVAARAFLVAVPQSWTITGDTDVSA